MTDELDELVRVELVLGDDLTGWRDAIHGMRRFVLVNDRFYLDEDRIAYHEYRADHPTCEYCGTEDDTVHIRDAGGVINQFLCDTCGDPYP